MDIKYNVSKYKDSKIQEIKDSISAKHFSEADQNANMKFKGKIEFKNVNFFY